MSQTRKIPEISGISDIVLVLNSGSSSVKYQLLHANNGHVLAKGAVERIGEQESKAVLHYDQNTISRYDRVANHEAALVIIFDLFTTAGMHLENMGIAAIGHRVVHGGPHLSAPTIINSTVLTQLAELAPLAPLHNPPALLGIEMARKVLPDLTHIAVFDTAFFHDLPDAAATYAIDRTISQRWNIRRYGFHGTSHHYISEQVSTFLNVSLESLNQIVLHLGNGASVSAVAAGRPVDTSMGMTPLEGLVMGTRCGDIDPGIISYLHRTAEMPIDDIDIMLNHRSGMLGLCGDSDFRMVHQRINAGDAEAQRAYDIYIHRLRKYIGAYLAVLGNTDVITFTAGVGEHDAQVRHDALTGMTSLGIELDDQLNTSAAQGCRRISTKTSPITVLVMQTNEELAIARACVNAVQAV